MILSFNLKIRLRSRGFDILRMVRKLVSCLCTQETILLNLERDLIKNIVYLERDLVKCIVHLEYFQFIDILKFPTSHFELANSWLKISGQRLLLYFYETGPIWNSALIISGDIAGVLFESLIDFSNKLICASILLVNAWVI